ASQGADQVLQGCAVIAACDTAVLLSPLDSADLNAVLAQFNPRPLMVVASQEDVDSFALASALDAAATGDKLFQPFDRAGHGTALLANRSDLGPLIIEWLQRQLIP
ncbi:MAG: hypothetical protein K8J31_23940, partial [Anaerolineae bacterium]|nr:hypothetical protein [Anaerolineae bacterium]